MASGQVVSHRKIELQSPEDLRYLLDNATRAAREKIDLNFPPSAAPADGEDDGLRRRVEELALEFVQSTFSLAAQNITVNGLDPPSSLTESLSEQPEEYEPFDGRLATKLQSLYATLESHSHSVAALRREAPANAAAAWRESFAGEMDEDDAAFERARARIAQLRPQGADTNEMDGTKVEEGTLGAGVASDTLPPPPPLDWQSLLQDEGSGLLLRREEIEKTWGISLEELEALKGTLPGTAAKLERAKAVAEYLDGPSHADSGSR
ncbi:MAG: glyceraldehyde-3-phosphate dehydrogenase 1 [Chaenotheca gracillima]|nr:MAG: glyceraldehyde-3-phosphate dehydrogenase 1 [Chaenotheca gracillima]